VDLWRDEAREYLPRIGVRWKKCAMRKRGSLFCPNLLPVKDPITRCGIENLVYRTFRSKITPALQATLKVSFNALK